MAENDATNGFNLESPKLASIYIPTSWSVILDMTSLATSGWQLLKFKKTAKNAAYVGFAVVYLDNRLS